MFSKPYFIHPVLVGKEVPTEIDAQLFARYVTAPVQSWFEFYQTIVTIGSVGTVLLPPNTPLDYFSLQQFAVDRDYLRGLIDGVEHRVLLIVEGYPPSHGDSGKWVGVVSYSVMESFRQWNNINQSLGLIAHEMGHLMGLNHLNNVARDLMHDQAWWMDWPNVGLSVRPE